MTTPPLLATKLYIPLLRPNLVARPRLLERLDQGLGHDHRLSLVCAPAGFGKTTLATAWLYSDYEHIAPRAVAWLSLDPGDDDPIRFLSYLIAALRQIDGRIGQEVQSLVESPQSAPPESLMALLVNDLSAVADPAVLVLDDYHLISSPLLHGLLGFLLDHQPLPLHLVLVTRQDPPLPLARLRGRSQITEIREQDLRFNTQEAADFLGRTMALPLQPEDVQALEAQTEGWITGLQLAALALEKERDPQRIRAFIASFTGDDRYVMDYLVAEVLERQPRDIRDFMRQTSILDRLTAPLCNALTSRQDSQRVLEDLEQASLFILPLDHHREWYRYHRLFAQALRTSLDHHEKDRLHQAAAHWFESQGMWRAAIEHALARATTPPPATGLTPVWDEAERLIRLAADRTLHDGGVLTVRGWLEALPDERVRASGQLSTYMGWALTLSGDTARATEYANTAKVCLQHHLAPDGAIDPAWGRLLALRSFLAVFYLQDYEAAVELARQALRSLGTGEDHWRVLVLWSLAEAQERTGHIAATIDTLREAHKLGRALHRQVFAATVELFLATALNMHGRRREALAVCRQVIDQVQTETGRVSLMLGPVFSLLGGLHLEVNDLEKARRHFEQGLALSEQLGLDSSSTLSLGYAALILAAQGEAAAALDALQRAKQLAHDSRLIDVDWCFSREAAVHLQQGNLAAAAQWAGDLGLTPNDPLQYLHLERHLVYGRLLLARDRLADARHWLDRLERFLHERGLVRALLTVRILQALTLARSGDRDTALKTLTAAIEFAAPQDYYRAFLDEVAQPGAAEHLVALLPSVHRIAPDFVDQLLAYAGAAQPTEEISTSSAALYLVEPPSERELEVLALIAQGLSNREIAGRLYIAVGTVKRHINNLYGKLQVRRRTEAIARARDLGLLP